MQRLVIALAGIWAMFGVAPKSIGQVYWIENGQGFSTLHGTSLDLLVTQSLIEFVQPDLPRRVAIDVIAEKIYWTNNVMGAGAPKKVQRANLDGSAIEDVLESPFSIGGIELDLVNDKLYWTTSTSVWRAELDGSGPLELLEVTAQASPFLPDLALDVAGGKIYWTHSDLPFNYIWRANLDGSDAEVILGGSSEIENNPTGITLDLAGRKVYWLEVCAGFGGLCKIRRANLNGTLPEDLLSVDFQNDPDPQLASPQDIALDLVDRKIYWSERGPADVTSGLRRANLDGTNVEQLISAEPNEPRGFVILFDCNGNDNPDFGDILLGTSQDCNGNQTPDECEPPADCNDNGIQDVCDMSSGLLNDCNVNAVADECEGADCNVNQVLDTCDLTFGTSSDCNANSVPDECDVANGASPDCNATGVPDECEFQDCNDNGLHDECELATFFSSGVLAPIGANTPKAFAINGPSAPDDVTLVFTAVADTDSADEWIDVTIDGVSLGSVFEFSTTGCSGPDTDHLVIPVDLYNSALSDGTATIQMTPTLNVATCFESFIIVRVAIPKAPDLECNGNLVPDLCDPNEDCNSNGVQDVCDIGTGFSLDTNENLVPDECDECIADFVACADLDGDLIRDDNCTWWECIQGDCVGTDIHFGDMGGSGGNCTHDGVVDGHDIYHALYCFVNKSLNGANPYPCDANAPQALHSDAGGRFGSCEPDGVGDIHDVYHVMNVFNGVSPCSTCPLDDPEGPAPAARRTRAGQSQVNSVRVFMAVDGLQAVSPTTGNTVLSMDPGTTAQVMMWIQALPPASGLLESYQLVLSHPALPQSGATGTVAYVNVPDEWGQSIKIDQDNADWVFTDLPPHPTYPLESDSHGLFGVAFYGAPGNAVDPAASSGAHYLAEFEIEASSHAQGEFELRFVVQAIPGNPQPLSALVGHQGTEYVVDEFQNLTILVGVPQCAESADCADVDDDGVRDDNCMWWTCARDVCLATDIVFADLGGAFGGCAPDGTADANDRFHALNCFSNSNTSGGPGYPCEVSPPQAFNVDAGGPFGVCQPDGVCDGNDAFHALNAFQGSATCSCPSGPEPTAPQPPVVVAAANIQLQADRSAVRAGEILEVEAFLATGLPDLRGYQLHVSVRGGTTGRLDLVDIAVQDREDAAFAGPADWQAFNIATRQMLAGLDGPGIKAGAGAYLATLVFRASDDAHGRFVVDLLHSGTDPAQRTFLFPTPPGSKITIDSVTPAVILVDRREDPTRRK